MGRVIRHILGQRKAMTRLTVKRRASIRAGLPLATTIIAAKAPVFGRRPLPSVVAPLVMPSPLKRSSNRSA